MFSLLNSDWDKKCITDALLADSMDLSFLMPAKDYPLVLGYLTYSTEDIKKRQELFKYISDNPSMVSFFDRLLLKVESMLECSGAERAVSGSESNETLYYSFREFSFFIEAIDDICESLKGCKVPGLLSLYEKAKEIQDAEWFKNAGLFVDTVDKNLRNIKSVTVGINLNAQLMPLEMGIVSIESEPYVTNSLFDKMFAPQIKDKKMICIAPLGINDTKLEPGQMRTMNINLYGAFNMIMKSSLKKIRGVLKNQFRQASAFLLNLHDELRFIDICIKYVLTVKTKGLPVCIPEIRTDACRIADLYNPNLLMYKSPDKIVKNDAEFDDTGKIHLVVGVNSGGKSVFMRSVGIVQILFQLGMPVPAAEAGMLVFSEIMSCFSAKIGDKKGGRLENECRLMSEICEKATEKSLILLDEIYSSTNSYDAALLARKTVEWFALKGCCAVYTTHIHELISKTDEINGINEVKSKVDILTADYQGEQATFRIERKKYNYESTAVHIFKKYGMDFIL